MWTDLLLKLDSRMFSDTADWRQIRWRTQRALMRCDCSPWSKRGNRHWNWAQPLLNSFHNVHYHGLNITRAINWLQNSTEIIHVILSNSLWLELGVVLQKHSQNNKPSYSSIQSTINLIYLYVASVHLAQPAQRLTSHSQEKQLLLKQHNGYWTYLTCKLWFKGWPL